MIFSPGCGEEEVHQSRMPKDFAAKLEKEHPELFVRKIGKNKTEKIQGRDKRYIILQEYEKARQKGTL